MFNPFAWIASLFRRSDLESFDLYKPKQRQIYRYFDGQKVVASDPLPLFIKVATKERELDADMRLARSIHPKAMDGHRAAMATIRGIFDLKEFADGGLTDWEASRLMDHFMTYCEELKKNSPPTPTSPEEASPPGPPSSGSSPPTSPGSGSGSTEGGPTTGTPPPSPSEPPSPTGPPSPE